MFRTITTVALSLLFFSPASVLSRETVEDAAVITRNLISNSVLSIASMATLFPANHSDTPNEPFSFQEYYASCLNNGSLTLLFFPISTHSKNILASPSHFASLSITSEPVPNASLPRVSLMGSVEIQYDVLEDKELSKCFLEKHPDAKWWVPEVGRGHMAYWARFDPHSIYFVGGFGGAHYIGSIPVDLYQRVFAPESEAWGEHPAVLVEQM